MTSLTAATRPVDDARAARLILAWCTGDKAALDRVLTEAMRDQPAGVPGVLFALTAAAAGLAQVLAPDDHVAQLQRAIASALARESPKDVPPQ